MKKNLYIYCSGGLGQEIAEYCKRIQEKYNRWNKIYYIDDVRQEKVFDGFEVFTYEEFKKIADKENSEVVIATGEPDARRLLFDKVDSDGYNFATIVAVTSIVEPSAKLGKGVVVAEFCHISTNAVLNENVFVNLHACVGHNCIIKKNVVVGPGVIIGGETTIGENTYLAIGTSVKNAINVGSWCIAAMNSAIIHDVDCGKIVAGIPAKVIKDNIEHGVFKKN